MEISGCKSARKEYLAAGSRLTDSGLPTMSRLAQLRDLYLSNTSASAPCRAALQKMLPNLRINF